jgi:transcriptional regulator with XRE-family HTH domain
VKLQEWLSSKGMTQTALADHLDVDQSAVVKWCSGENRPRALHIAIITSLSEGAVTIADFYPDVLTSKRKRVAR